MASPCTKEMKRQIKAEMSAAMQYLAMGAHFSRDVINRPGFAKLFFDSASEERQHAIHLIEYLSMRGELTSGVYGLLERVIQPENTIWVDGVSALKDALKLEALVTKSIRKVIAACENSTTESSTYNDYHVSNVYF